MNPLGGTPPDGDFARLIDELGRDAAARMRAGSAMNAHPDAGHLSRSTASTATPTDVETAQHSPGRVVRTPSDNPDWEKLVQAVAPAMPWLKGLFFGLIALISVGAVFPQLKPIGWTAWIFYALYGIVRFKIPRDATVHFFRHAMNQVSGKS